MIAMLRFTKPIRKRIADRVSAISDRFVPNGFEKRKVTIETRIPLFSISVEYERPETKLKAHYTKAH